MISLDQSHSKWMLAHNMYVWSENSSNGISWVSETHTVFHCYHMGIMMKSSLLTFLGHVLEIHQNSRRMNESEQTYTTNAKQTQSKWHTENEYSLLT